MNFIPESLAIGIYIDSIMLKRNENGWREINKFIKDCKPLYVKMTNNIYNNDFKYSSSIIRAKSFYSEKRMYTWTKKSDIFGNSDIYIYKNPFQNYSFLSIT